MRVIQIIFIAYKYKGYQATGELIYFFQENNLYSFLDSKKDYKGYVVEPFINKRNWIPLNWNPEKMLQDDSIDYMEEYLQFKNNLKTEYQGISVCLFLKFYPGMLLQEEILKLLKV